MTTLSTPVEFVVIIGNASDAKIVITTTLGFQRILTHWGRVTDLWVDNITIIGADNGLSPGRYQASTWINAGILLIGPWETKFTEIVIEIHAFSFKKMHLKMASGKWRPFCLSLDVLTHLPLNKMAANLADDIFKCIFLNKNVWISLKFAPRVRINNIPTLVQIMAWRRIGDKPLSELMLTRFTDAYMRH